MLHNALLYDKLENATVRCNLCAHRCLIAEGQRGICRVRENHAGELFTLVYGNLIASNCDPIEKKPLYHFLPGTRSYSIATPGCNFRCSWCQNWQISQMPRIMHMPEGDRVMPEAVIREAERLHCQSIAYTYTEPTIFFEFSFDVAQLAKKTGIKNIYVTNGFMTPEMLRMIAPYLDAANVDIKAFKDETYRKFMGGRLEPVLESCKLMKALGIWLEITTLIVPEINDDPEELKGLATFILNELGPETPWHLSRFYPQYKMTDRGATNENLLNETKHMGEALGLHHIYEGNVQGSNNTVCRECGQDLILRHGYTVQIKGLNGEGKCTACGTPFDGAI